MIDTEAIKARLNDLRVQHDQAIAQVNAILGAIQDCEYWLAKADEKAIPPKE